MDIPYLELVLGKMGTSGGLFYIKSALLEQKILTVGKKYKLTIEEVK